MGLFVEGFARLKVTMMTTRLTFFSLDFTETTLVCSMSNTSLLGWCVKSINSKRKLPTARIG